jgi:signal transduction histidine kinase
MSDKRMGSSEVPADRRPPFRASSASPEPAAAEAPVRILIVDDEPRNLIVLETILDQPGYELVRARSGDEALLALVSGEFALLILDIRMPGMSGFDLAKIIQGRKKSAQIPIIFLTAYYNEDQHVLEGYGTGAVDYLHKPVNVAMLRSKVAVFVALYRKQQEVLGANRALLAEVSERRKAEEQLRVLNESLDQRVHDRTAELLDAHRRKDEFLATLAHELRNPLAPVRNAVELLHRIGAATPEVQWARAIIDRQTRNLTRLIDDLMDVSRISRGQMELRRERVECAQVVQAAVETSRPVIEEHGHRLTVSLPPSTVLLDGDPTRLAQVFLNLLNNAAKYMEGAGLIELRAELHGNRVAVSVRDAGIGIAAENLPLVFDMFSRVETGSNRSRGGLGIGLYLSKQIVELHGGSIEARSDGLGTGSEFLVSLPTVTESADPVEEHDGEDQVRVLPGLRILVADDNQDAALSLTKLLELMGSNVHTVCDSREVLAAADAFRPEVVLCDIGMPEMDGYEVCRRIRKEPWGKDMVLIAVTGWGQPEDRQQSRAAGFDGHLVKPVDLQALLELLTGLKVVSAGSWARL